MKTRSVAVMIAFLLAAGATLGVFLYVRGVKHNNATSAANMTTVIVSKQDISAGTKLDSLISSGAFTTLQVPNDAVISGSVTDLSQLQGQTTSTFILKGEQIATARLQGSTAETGGALGIPNGYEAVSVSLEAQRTVNAVPQAGDHVVVYATLAQTSAPAVGAKSGPETVIVVPDVEVLANPAGVGIVTLALKPLDASKVILAQSQGDVWLSLLPPNANGTQQPPVRLGDLGRVTAAGKGSK